jgi:FKBP-type peptidyl-prolyl cis-trans isomerase
MKIFKNVLFVFSLMFLVSLTSCLSDKEPIEDQKARENDEAIQAYLKSKNITAQKTADNVYYVITKSNPSGKAPVIGDLIKFQYLISRLDGFKLDSTKAATPTYSLYGTIGSDLFSYVTAYMKEGEKMTIFLNHKLAFGAQETANLPAYSPIALDFSVEKLSNEEEQIESYIADNKLVATKTSTGLRYSIANPIAAGTVLTKGQKVSVKYTGKLLYYAANLDASNKPTTVFDSGTFSFTLGNGEVVAGWDEGLTKFKVGEKGVIVFPSSLGYKDVGSGTIPPKAPLAFEVEVISAQ